MPFGASQPRSQERTTLIDRLRHDIQQRLEELLAEADKLRRALAVLDPRKRSRLDAKTAKPRPAAKARPAPLAAAKHAPARTRTRAADAKDGAGASTRTAPGETKAKVLAALSGDQALTAGEVAKATGVARPTVSTTLSKLAKTGAIVKAERGYRLPSIDGATPSATEPTATPSTHDAYAVAQAHRLAAEYAQERAMVVRK